MTTKVMLASLIRCCPSDRKSQIYKRMAGFDDLIPVSGMVNDDVRRKAQTPHNIIYRPLAYIFFYLNFYSI